jgi:hypothetical protein
MSARESGNVTLHDLEVSVERRVDKDANERLAVQITIRNTANQAISCDFDNIDGTLAIWQETGKPSAESNYEGGKFVPTIINPQATTSKTVLLAAPAALRLDSIRLRYKFQLIASFVDKSGAPVSPSTSALSFTGNVKGER